MSEHDGHSTFIKTPQQLIVVIVLSFVIPIIGIIMMVQLVTGQPGADPNAMRPEAVAARLAPVGQVEFGEARSAPGARSGEAIVKATCAACHTAGVANAPKIGDLNAWAPHIKEGLKGMVQTAIKGKGAMPPKGGDASLTDEEIARAVVFMANQSGAKFKEPAPAAGKPAAEAAAPAAPAAAPAPAPAQAAAAAQKPAALDGKAIYEKSACVACHAAGVAGAPKVGDKAAWGPRIKQGTEALVQTVIKGKGAMPPKGGTAMSDAEIRAAVDYLVSQAK